MIRGWTNLSEMTERNGSASAEPSAGESRRAALWARPRDPRLQHRWVPLVAGWLVLLVGLANIVVIVIPGTVSQAALHHRFARIVTHTPGVIPPDLPFPTTSEFKATAVVIGLLLLLLAHGLFRRKRRAWQAAMGLLLIILVIYMWHHHPVSSGIILALIVAGLYFSGEFYAAGDPRTRWRAVLLLVALVVADFFIGLVYVRLHVLAVGYSPWQRISAIFYGLIGQLSPGDFRFTQSGPTDLFIDMTAGLGVLTLAMVIYTAYLFLRPAEPAASADGSDAGRIRALLDKYGESDSLGYFALRGDKSVIWSSSGKSCIGYRVLSGVMLASGDPLGDPEAWPGAISAFLDEAARHAWVPAVIGCSELGAEVWCREGDLTALELGDEAVVQVATFTLQGRAMRNVRQMVSRVERHGYQAQIRRVGEMAAGEIDALVRQADAWRGSPTERGFSMALGRVGGPEDERCVIATATQDGMLKALLHFVPWGSDGLSLDLMRRDRAAQPGLNDFMIVEVIRRADELGVKKVSLNFAAFRAALERGEKIGAGPVSRAWRRFLLFLSRWFQIESLYKFNAKFCPEWVPRFLVYPGTGDALRVGMAALEAEAFLVWPTLQVRRIARKLGFHRWPRRKQVGAEQ